MKENNYNIAPILYLVASTVIFTDSVQAKNGISAELEIEATFFRDPAFDPRQEGDGLTYRFQPKYFKKFDNSWSFKFSPFFRYDQQDGERTHNDIRELALHKKDDLWEAKLGISKVFWGVTKSQYLVDIINQTDLIENIDGTVKLGQPMINLALKQKWGKTELFVLPYFRERTYESSSGRLRFLIPVDTGQAVYESSQEKKHVDYAVRWSHKLSVWNIGLSHFTGTSRAPRFTLGANVNGETVLVPNYDQIEQTGLDLKATTGRWIWKLDLINRQNPLDSYIAWTAGFQYNRKRVFKSKKDMAILVEYMYDDRNDPSKTVFERDIFLAAILKFNNPSSTAVIASYYIDEDSDERIYKFEIRRKIGKSSKLSAEAIVVSNAEVPSPLYNLRRDSYLRVKFTKQF